MSMTDHSNMTTQYILVNFGGPRDLNEIASFLSELLCDKDVVRTGIPNWIHDQLFKRIAKKRSKKVREEYESMGGCSPIYEDTEKIAAALSERINEKIFVFHRYLPATHQSFIKKIKACNADRFRVIPLFPQFTYATTGSVARWFQDNLPFSSVNKMRWVRSYASHPLFIQSHQNAIREFMVEHALKSEECVLLFSAHGIPQSFVDTGDVYKDECRESFAAIASAFPESLCRLSFQSKFGPGQWLKPYTTDVCNEITSWSEGRKEVIFIPISFTSDHIETLCEIENDYMPPVRDAGLQAWRVPALTLRPDWIEALAAISQGADSCSNMMLVRPGG